jgi:hypothetical protein
MATKTSHGDDGVFVANFPKNVSEEVRVEVGEYRGVARVDVRVWQDSWAGAPFRTKKGLSLSVDLIPELIAGLEAALDYAETA